MMAKLVRIGRDAELRAIASGTSVVSIPCVYDIGFGDKKRGQWIDVSIWGKQAEALAQYLTKGKQIVIYADDVELEEYQKKDGTMGSKLKCRAVNIDLTSGGQAPQQGYQQAPQQRPQAPQYQAPQNSGQNMARPPQVNPSAPKDEPFDSDIPFAPIGLQHNSALMLCI